MARQDGKVIAAWTEGRETGLVFTLVPPGLISEFSNLTTQVSRRKAISTLKGYVITLSPSKAQEKSSFFPGEIYVIACRYNHIAGMVIRRVGELWRVRSD